MVLWGKKKAPRWLWHAIDHRSGKVLAYVLGRRKDEVFLQLQALFASGGITRYDTDYWGASTHHLAVDTHTPGKQNTQKIVHTPEIAHTREAAAAKDDWLFQIGPDA